MADYHTFTPNRTTRPDPSAVLTGLRALDATAGVFELQDSWRVKKATAWTAPQIAAAQNVIDTAPASSPQLTAQAQVDALPLVEKAIILALIDQLNVIRSKLTPPLPVITPAQAIDAVRQKAGTLS